MTKFRINFRTIASLIISTSIFGCVSSKKYQAALDDIARMRTDSTVQASKYADLQYDNSKALADAREEIRDANKQLDSLKSIADERKHQLELISNQLHAALPAMENEKLDTYVDERFLHISLPHRVLFNTGEAELTNEGKMVVKQISTTLKHVESDIMILGHADSVPYISSSRNNWELSYERAQSVLKVMVENGISSDQLIVAGRGDYDPSIDNGTQIGRLLNRRIELIVMPDMQVIESVMEQVSISESKF